MKTLIDEDKIKGMLKEAIVEVVEEKKDIFHDLLVEAIEDIALVNEIKEGEKTNLLSRADIFKVLES